MHWADQTRRWLRIGLCGLLCLAVQGLAIADTSTPTTKPAQASATPAVKANHHTSGHSAATSSHTVAQKSKNSRGKKGSKYSRKRGQQAIDSGRARQIQTALIREHYMQG